MLQSRLHQIIKPCCICIMCIELESWFLADQDALQELGIIFSSPGPTDQLDKEKLKNLCQNIDFAFTEIDFADQIKHVFCFERASKKTIA